MTADLEMVLVHDGERWLAHGGPIRASGRTLPELDAALAGALRANGRFPGPRVTVFMGFDFDCFPVWMRQYAAHYFNRTVSLDLSGPGGPPRAATAGRDRRGGQ